MLNIENKKFKLIISSATIATESFLSDFPSLVVFDVPCESTIVKKEIQFHNYDFSEPKHMIYDIVNVINKIEQTQPYGNTIVFLDGEESIHTLTTQLEADKRLKHLEICPLHGNMEKEEQTNMLKITDKRKVLVATNIIESSVTIPHTTHVISSGYCKIMHSHPDGTQELKLSVCSKANITQQAGREGRDTTYDNDKKLVHGYTYVMMTQDRFDYLPEEAPRDVDINPLFHALLKIINAKKNPFVLFNDLDKKRIIRDMRFLQEYGMIDIIINFTAGISPVEFDKIKTVKYIKLVRLISSSPDENEDDQEEEEQCSICMTEYKSNDEISILACNPKHNFHSKCILQWLETKKTCPLCRQISTEHSICEICFEPFVDGQKLGKLKCNHTFHLQCIESRLDHSTHCPYNDCQYDCQDENAQIDYKDADQLYRITDLGINISQLPTSIPQARLLYLVAKNCDRSMLYPLCVLIARVDTNGSPFYRPRRNASESNGEYSLRLENISQTHRQFHGVDDVDTLLKLFKMYCDEYENKTSKKWLTDNYMFTKFYSEWYSSFDKLHKSLSKLGFAFSLDEEMISYDEFSEVWPVLAEAMTSYQYNGTYKYGVEFTGSDAERTVVILDNKRNTYNLSTVGDSEETREMLAFATTRVPGRMGFARVYASVIFFKPHSAIYVNKERDYWVSRDEYDSGTGSDSESPYY